MPTGNRPATTAVEKTKVWFHWLFTALLFARHGGLVLGGDLPSRRRMPFGAAGRGARRREGGGNGTGRERRRQGRRSAGAGATGEEIRPRDEEQRDMLTVNMVRRYARRTYLSDASSCARASSSAAFASSMSAFVPLLVPFWPAGGFGAVATTTGGGGGGRTIVL